MNNPFFNSSVGDVDVQSRNPPIPEGDHRMKITSVQMMAGTKNRGKNYVVVEVECVASTNPDLVGQVFADLSEYPGEYDRGDKFCKAMIAAAFGYDPDDQILKSKIVFNFDSGQQEQAPGPRSSQADLCSYVMLLSTHYAQCPIAGREVRITGTPGKERPAEKGGGRYVNRQWVALPDPAWVPRSSLPQPPAGPFVPPAGPPQAFAPPQSPPQQPTPAGPPQAFAPPQSPPAAFSPTPPAYPAGQPATAPQPPAGAVPSFFQR